MIETWEQRVLARIDERTDHMHTEQVRQQAQLRMLELHDSDHETRLRALEEKEAVSRQDLRRFALFVSLVVVAALGGGTILFKGALDNRDSPTAIPSAKTTPVEVTP